ncbi:hypothetical protein [Kribbella sp.]|uniref:hypothetical protein n=1 Tax=Kribbella sp. TaxID=1871183 RepID=UPI002D2C5DB1|nr:hypothetical protein [Kribbella sp.]HZX01415.1 hypothetical protein [Kribbella sp.]
MRILVLQRDGGAGTVAALRAAGFEADLVGDRVAAARVLKESAYDGVVADDLSLVVALRRDGVMVPALVIGVEGDGAALVQYGADDYLGLPVDPSEVVERVRSICREPVSVSVQRFDDVDQAVLEVLLRTPGALVTRARLEQECGADVDAVVEQIRERVGDAIRIDAVRGIGFRAHEAEAGQR